MSKGLIRVRLLKVTGCQDGMMWYASLVGEYVPCLGLEYGEWKSRAPSGYSNFIAKNNAIAAHVLVSANRLGEYPYKYAQIDTPGLHTTPSAVAAKSGCRDLCDMLGVCRGLPDCEESLGRARGLSHKSLTPAPVVGQSHLASAAEVGTNIVLGFVFSMAITAVLLPAMGHQVTLTENVAMTSVFTFASVARSWGLRRFFNRLHLRGQGRKT